MLYGVRGLSDNFLPSEPGDISVVVDEKQIRFARNPNGHCFWLKLASHGEDVAREIEDLMVYTPRCEPSRRK